MRSGVDRSADGKIAGSAVAKTHTNPGADTAAAPSAAFESGALAQLRTALSRFFAKTTKMRISARSYTTFLGCWWRIPVSFPAERALRCGPRSRYRVRARKSLRLRSRGQRYLSIGASIDAVAHGASAERRKVGEVTELLLNYPNLRRKLVYEQLAQLFPKSTSRRSAEAPGATASIEAPMERYRSPRFQRPKNSLAPTRQRLRAPHRSA